MLFVTARGRRVRRTYVSCWRRRARRQRHARPSMRMNREKAKGTRAKVRRGGTMKNVGKRRSSRDLMTRERRMLGEDFQNVYNIGYLCERTLPLSQYDLGEHIYKEGEKNATVVGEKSPVYGGRR